jgi:hypothetical protein
MGTFFRAYCAQRFPPYRVKLFGAKQRRRSSAVDRGRSPAIASVFRKPRDLRLAVASAPTAFAEKCWTARADASSWRDLLARGSCAMSRPMRLPISDVSLLPSVVPRSETQYVGRVAHVQALPSQPWIKRRLGKNSRFAEFSRHFHSNARLSASAVSRVCS